MKKIGLLCLALVLALGSVGFGYAYWSETLDIGQNQVNTGEVDAEFGDNPIGSWRNANAGTTCTISKTGPQTLSVSLGNLYPSEVGIWWGAGFLFQIKNTGTVPAKISGLMISKTSGDGGLWSYLQCLYDVKHYNAAGWTGWQFYSGGLGPPSSSSWDVLLPGLAGKVLLPGERFQFYCDEEGSMNFYVHKNAPDSVEGKSVSFDITFTVTQFNAP